MKDKYITFCIGDEEYTLRRNQFLRVILINPNMPDEDKYNYLIESKFSPKFIALELMKMMRQKEISIDEILNDGEEKE